MPNRLYALLLIIEQTTRIRVKEFENNQANQHKLINKELDIIINNMNDDALIEEIKKLIEDYRYWNYEAKINVKPDE